MTADARDPSDTWLADNRLTRGQWEAMVQREVEKMRKTCRDYPPAVPAQGDLFAA